MKKLLTYILMLLIVISSNYYINIHAEEDVTINFDANDGNGTMNPVAVAKGSEYVLPESEFVSPDGYIFEAWEFEGVKYNSKEKIVVNEETTIKAIWKWAQGTIHLDFGFAPPYKFRNVQYPMYAYTGWLLLPYMSVVTGVGGSATLYDSNGNVVESYTDEDRHDFKNLPAGNYTLRLDSLDEGIYSVFQGVHNGTPISKIIIWFEDSPLLNITVNEGDTNVIRRWVVLEYKVYGFKTVTEIGTFKDAQGSNTPGKPSSDKKEYVYYGGGSWYLDDYPDYVNYIPYAQTHDGIYYGDYAYMYTGMSSLQVPTLSEEEKALGYTFKGWKLQGDSSGKIYTESEALRHIVRGDVVFEAVWDYPTYNVTVSDDGNGTALANPVFGPTLTEVTITATPNEGYMFKNWQLISGDVTISDLNNSIATFNIKKSDVEIKANFVRSANITYKLNGGSYNGSFDDIIENHEIGTTIKIHEKPVREGYTFKCWEGSEYYPNEDYLVEEDHIFTAVWEKQSQKTTTYSIPKTGIE